MLVCAPALTLFSGCHFTCGGTGGGTCLTYASACWALARRKSWLLVCVALAHHVLDIWLGLSAAWLVLALRLLGTCSELAWHLLGACGPCLARACRLPRRLLGTCLAFAWYVLGTSCAQRLLGVSLGASLAFSRALLWRSLGDCLALYWRWLCALRGVCLALALLDFRSSSVACFVFCPLLYSFYKFLAMRMITKDDGE